MVKETSGMKGSRAGEIETRTSRIWLEDGIIRVLNLPGSGETLEDAEEKIVAIKKIAGNKKRPLFIEPGQSKPLSREARIYYMETAPEIASAMAGISRSPLSRIMANFLIALNKTINKNKFPLKFFTMEEKALDWLKEFIR